MDDGRVVFVDRNSGMFYDENNQLLSETEQIEAREQYDTNDSDIIDKNYADNEFNKNESKHKMLLEKKDRLQSSRKDYENGDLTEDEFESELESIETDPDLHPHLELKSASDANHETSSTTSIAKHQDKENGINTDVNMAAAFRNAGSGQPMEQPDQNHDLQETVRPITPGMGIG